jgi:hypothetical protein
MALVGLCLALYVGPVELTPESRPQFMQCLKVAFPIFAGLCFLGLFASLARGNVRPERSDREPSVAP